MRILFIQLALLLLLPSLAFSQADDPKVLQLSGMVTSKNSNEPIPYVRIQVNHTRRGAITNSEGFYSVPVGLGDTLYFTHVGYHPSTLIVADYADSYKGNKNYLFAVNYLLEDTATLDTVLIFPYDTPEELRTAVVNLDIFDNSPEAVAQQNLDPSTLHAIMETLPVDGGERLMVARQMYYDYYQNKNLQPTIGLDPITITRFLQYVVNRTKKKKNKDLNYWDN
ncbi:MAG: carboxypeptidase-like regulatory domain-containing protein [Bacteroidota bacterium]